MTTLSGPAPAQATGWSARQVAAYLAAGLAPARLRQLMGYFPDHEAFTSDWEANGDKLAAAGWPQPLPPSDLPEGTWVLLAGDSGYPPALHGLRTPPLVLFGTGNPAALTPGLAVTGSRDGTPYGTVVAHTAAQTATELGVPVASGAARGCDTAAHTAALEAGGVTVAVVATGVDVAVDTNPLLGDILASGGAVISEHPPGTGPGTDPTTQGYIPAPLPQRLVARNRIIAGLSCGTVLAEALPGSGSVHTAWCTLGLGRPLLVALPRRHARDLPHAKVPLALADRAARTVEHLRAMGAPTPVAQAWAGRSPLASGVAQDRDDLADLVRAAVLLSPHHTPAPNPTDP